MIDPAPVTLAPDAEGSTDADEVAPLPDPTPNLRDSATTTELWSRP